MSVKHDYEGKYRLLINNLPLAYAHHRIITDDEGKPVDYTFLDINPAFEKLTGYTRNEVLGKRVTEIYPGIEDLNFDWIGTNGRLALQGGKICFEQYFEPAHCWYEVTAYSNEKGFFFMIFWDVTEYRQDEKRRVVHDKGILDINGAWKDVTGYRLVEEELRETVEKFRAAFEGSHDAIVIVTRDKFIDCNQRALDLFELDSKEEFREKRPAHYSPSTQPNGEDSLTLAKKRIDESLDKKLACFEWVFQSKSGRIFPAEVIHTVYVSRGKTYLQATIRDITERKVTEEALQKSEERYRLLVNNANEAIVIAQDGMLKFVNQKAEELYGYSEEVLTSTPFIDFVHPEDRAFLLQRYRDRISRKVLSDRYNFRIVAGDGSVKWAEVSTVSIDWEGLPAALNMITDISERKKAEDKIRHISFHDSLTGLYNRAYLEEEMQRLDTKRQIPLGMIMADVNGLKLVNDTYGHGAGDEMLKSAARIIRDSCRAEDVVARWGGDEFVVILPRTNGKDADAIKKRIYNNCEGAYVENVPISLALGAAIKDRTEKGLETVLKEAENNMYRQKLAESKSARSNVLSALLKTLETKSFETDEHTRRMQWLAQKMGDRIGLPDMELTRLKLLITLHDIGKINISEEVLTKNGPLTEKEWEIMKKHPETGYRIARTTEEFAHVAEEILAHHERWDGTGYPRGLRGNSIPLLARVAAIADAYEVMAHGRAYKKALTHGKIVDEFQRCSGTQFDPVLVKVFLEIIKKESMPDVI